MATETTRTQRLADHLLDGQLAEFVRERRTARHPLSWRQVAEDLNEATGLDIHHETLRVWFPEYRDTDRSEVAS